MGTPQVPYWNVPYRRNPYFTGREELLTRLHEQLQVKKATALTQPQAISGLGGIGKTQIAVEYAYRYQDDYQAIVWVRAETDVSIISDLVTIAHMLDLPEKQEQEQLRIVQAVKHWFQDNTGWLLIFDNADDLAKVRDFLPSAGKGHILLTTRAHATGRIAQRIEVEKMEPEEGALFLLHRATLLDPDAPLEAASITDQDTAREITQEMDGLPLALDQAGAYIEETGCGLNGYLQLYRVQGAQLLKERGGLDTDHPEPVATTWSLSFKKVEHANAAAAELLRFCAFLAPDAIPEELFPKSAADLGPTLELVASDPSKLNSAIRELLKFSLVQRDPESRTLSIHRLVQEVLKDQMDEEVQREWAERAVRAVNRAFPAVEYETWDQCLRVLTHAQTCADLITKWNIELPQASSLLFKTGTFLRVHGQYVEAESLLRGALAIDEKTLGSDHPDLAFALNNLAFFYMQVQHNYVKAEPLIQHALAISERTLGPDHADTANTIHALADLYRGQGKEAEVEPLLKRALAIREQALGPGHPDTANTLHDLADLYRGQGKFVEAEPLYQRALMIKEQTLGTNHPEMAGFLSNMAQLYRNLGKYVEAETLLQRALAINEQAFGPDHHFTAGIFNNLADLYQAQEKHTEAEPLYQRSLAILEQALGLDHPNIAWTLDGLATLYQAQGKHAEAESLFKRALAIREQALGPDHHYTAIDLNHLANLYQDQGKYAEAEPLYQRSLAIKEKGSVPEHLSIEYTLKCYATLLRKMQRTEEAAQLEERARAIRAKRSS
jgi:tetratricopeptide (TPR) repeat protein